MIRKYIFLDTGTVELQLHKKRIAASSSPWNKIDRHLIESIWDIKYTNKI